MPRGACSLHPISDKAEAANTALHRRFRLAIADIPANNPFMILRSILLASVCVIAATVFAAAQGIALLPEPRPFATSVPFTQTLSNTTPLVFGMTAGDAATALQVPLTYVSGKPGSEMFVAERRQWGAPFFEKHAQLYLQFRNGRLTGWKGDWSRNWMWR